MTHRTLAYEVIADKLRKAVLSKSLPDGTVLLEGPIGALFDSSRSPVKKALVILEAEGLVRRFDGRGVLAGAEGEPLRIGITSEMLGLDDEGSASPKTFAWQNFYYDFENTVILRAVFGRFRINELALARHYNVGRTVAGDILNHAAESGIVERDDKSRWWINPLDEERFRNIYEVRLLLEPAALKSAMQRIPADTLETMRQRLIEVSDRFPQIASAELDSLEEDLHITTLQYSANGEILEALKRTRCVLVAGKHIQRAVRGTLPIDAFMDEHLDIMNAIAADNYPLAEQALTSHLQASSTKAKERLQAYLATSTGAPISYVLD
ncbi:FCD domain-containing protein [Rhizobium ruizarguesonis]|uniref:GntR family transcriptional regulator n=1 Tax=Rhizobium ruizarguesonis TaxID=2081791 RepID=UPI0004012104|nr:GntR family transcriptional regulator [Rhizobium ruizarguesonis]MBY5851607.1 GntR family transcriptional regulator [Rhizobium leguminosarum]NKL13370.1 FCD domain-containing protein [Rhizobium leguminosarum bv. viciae]MBY5873390.1 GntR family transcriptional regulator [Rhizobium leguminosarum]MBY5892408.1 GntR family transcriptional regulator [Rhizobium leguminosarum]NEH38251.1 FCD domain-containing protein [Rhizobium ruizarguesonis]